MDYKLYRLKSDQTYAEFLHAAKPGTLAPIDQRMLKQDTEWVAEHQDRAALLDSKIGQDALLTEKIGTYLRDFRVTVIDRWCGHLIVYSYRTALAVLLNQLDFDAAQKEKEESNSSAGNQGGSRKRSRVQKVQARGSDHTRVSADVDGDALLANMRGLR